MHRSPWLLRAASSGRESVEAARRILESDAEQLALILTTLVAAVVYGWIEGYVITSPRYEPTQILWILGHFSTYSLAMALLFVCITGGFGLLKARSMFAKGKRYFLFTFAGNFPFSWLVEDFAFFWFSPDWRLTDERWTNWFLGGVWILDPWREGVKIWIPNWYWPVLVFWLAMMWYAHRCTVYDNLVKDEIAREIVPRKVEIPRVEVKVPEPSKPREELVERKKLASQEELQMQAGRATVEAQPSPLEILPAPKPERSSTGRAPMRRSPEAEQALQRLREKWMISEDNAS